MAQQDPAALRQQRTTGRPGASGRRVWSSFHAAQEVDDVGTKAGQRDFFDAPRDIGQLAAVETREKQNGPAAFLTFRGTF